jgi:PIN domain nuclease of toxin-antitoxin system
VTILLDTHVLVWFVDGHEMLGRRARELLGRHADDLAISAMTCWETAMLCDKGRMTLSAPLADWMLAVAASGIKVVEIDATIGVRAGTLPGNIHSDPGDRMIVATARDRDCTLLTADEKILRYAAAGHLRAIDARA